MTENHDLLEVIEAIDPAACSYEEWVQVGMALKDAGHPVGVWDRWSQRDERYRAGECERKWNSFRGSFKPVTGGTVVSIARSQGWRPSVGEGYELSWDDVIGPRDEGVVVKDTAWIEAEEVMEPDEWDPAAQLITYLETLFEASENVGYVTKTWERDGRHLPTKGDWDRSAGELIQALHKCDGDIGSVLGDYNPQAGAWIRFNPLDGQGCKNDNVTEFRYALVESDSMDVETQFAIIKQLELPAAMVVHSGGKSVHAIVRVDAADYDEYRKRVDYLYDVCKKNGLAVDAQNKNPSRLSRMPGVTRGERKQFIVARNIGRESWSEWVDWIEAETDVLPVDVTNFEDEWDEQLPEQKAIVAGILGTNEKMMLSSTSKAGKTFALLELCAAIANGDDWMGARCTQGHVLYLNFELKRESRIRRMRQICQAKGYSRANASRMHFLDLRGHSAPLSMLMAKIVRQAAKYGCSVIVIDPIYKVMSGDENNAEAVGQFCNQLDALGQMMDCSIVYCHHYSKGQQGQKSSMDRASGSGVFARDVDALLAMTELEVTEATRKSYLNHVICKEAAAWLDCNGPRGWREQLPQDALVVADDLRSECRKVLPTETMNALIRHLAPLEEKVGYASAWRIESTLRDFAPHRPIDIWYRHPIHENDDADLLADAQMKDMVPVHKKGSEATKKRYDKERDEKKRLFENALANAKAGEPITRREAAEYIGEYGGKTVTKTTIRNWMEKWPEYEMGPGDVIVKKVGADSDNG